jgi:2-oxoglutarate ferredoxin oxidoreductase subunit alpha
MPANTGDVLRRYRRVLVPELNAGQLASVLRSEFAVEVVSLTKTQGRPFLSSEIEMKIESLVQEKTA